MTEQTMSPVEQARAARAAQIKRKKAKVASRNRKFLVSTILLVSSPLAFAGFQIINDVPKAEPAPLQLAAATVSEPPAKKAKASKAQKPADTVTAAQSQQLQEVLSDNARLRSDLERLSRELAQVRAQLAAALGDADKIQESLAVANHRLDEIQASATKLAVNFKFGKSTFEPAPDVAEQLATLAQDSDKINVSGFTDSRGTAEANRVVAMQRAIAAKQHLIEQGINEAKINVFAKPGVYVASNDTIEGRAANRRVELEFIQADAPAASSGNNVASK